MQLTNGKNVDARQHFSRHLAFTFYFQHHKEIMKNFSSLSYIIFCWYFAAICEA
jgi:hypothetical protein